MTITENHVAICRVCQALFTEADMLDTGLWSDFDDADNTVICDRCNEPEPCASERHDHDRTESQFT